MATISVPFEEHHDSPQLSGNRDGENAFSRKFIVEYNDLLTFLNEMFKGGWLGLPQPFSNNWPHMYADTWKLSYPVSNATGSTTMTDPAAQAITHDGQVFVDITYSSLKLNPEDEPPFSDGSYVEYSREDASEFVTLPARTLQWETDGKLLPTDRNPVMFVPEARHVLTWSRVVNPPWAAFSQLKGTVNLNDYRLPGTTQWFASESLMFESAVDSGKVLSSFNSSDPPTAPTHADVC